MAAATDPMNALGLPIPSAGREKAYRWLRDDVSMTAGAAWELVGLVSRYLEGDEPFQAERAALKSLVDVTGYYRLAATLLASVEVEVTEAELRRRREQDDIAKHAEQRSVENDERN